jgi:hypothetical protein
VGAKIRFLPHVWRGFSQKGAWQKVLEALNEAHRGVLAQFVGTLLRVSKIASLAKW